MTKKLPCQKCGKRHMKHSAVLKCGRINQNNDIELSISRSEELGEIGEIEKFLTNSHQMIIQFNKAINQMIDKQNSLQKKIKKAEIKRKQNQSKSNANISMVNNFLEILKIDLDSIRMMALTIKLDILSKKMRLSRTYPKHRDPQCKNWFMIIDEPFYISIPKEKAEKWIQSIKKFCQFQESFNFVSTTTVWIPTQKIIESLLENKINVVRLNAHGLKTFKFQWVDEVISHDIRNSFDFGIYAKNFPKSMMFTFFHRTMGDQSFYPMLGFSSIGNQELQLGVQSVKAKIYSTIVHHLKYRTNISWEFSKNTTNLILRRKLKSIQAFIDNLDENTDFPMRLQVTVKQNIVNKKMQSFSAVKENAEGYLKVLNRKFDSMLKVKVPISTYKKNVKQQIQKLEKKLSQDREKVQKEILDEFAYLENCVGWYHFMIKNRIEKFLKSQIHSEFVLPKDW